MLRRPAQVERAAVHDQQHDRRAGRGDGLQQLELAARQLQRRARRGLADHVLPLADHDHRDVGRARERRPRARARPRRRTPPGPPARCRRTCRTSTGTRAARGARPARTRPARRPTLRADAVQHGHGLVEVVVEAPRAERVALASPRAARSPRSTRAPGVERQQVALVAQQHRRALGRDARDLAVGGVAEHLARALLVDVRVVEQPQRAASPPAPAARSRRASPRSRRRARTASGRCA